MPGLVGQAILPAAAFQAASSPCATPRPTPRPFPAWGCGRAAAAVHAPPALPACPIYRCAQTPSGAILESQEMNMANELAALSNEIAAAVEVAGKNVVAVHARPRFSSSGVFWRPGVIVTAEHTIQREEEITVTLPDGRNAPATLAGSDAGTDLAVLKIEGAAFAPGHTTAAPAAGTLALAIGRSEDSGVNATLGIISACSGEWRTWRGGRLDHYIRLDLTLYPGSDGGAVVNTAGETIGIATSALSRIAGLAIPAVTVDRVVDEILARGRVARGYLGVGLQPVELPDHQKGLIVLSLEPAGPAAAAGVLIGDILVKLGGKAVHDTEDIQLGLEGHAVGLKVEVEVLRGGEARQVNVVVGERPRRN
uniref:PDZ/DHR/GLGF domain protein n=1 Tax=Solibacter usitatus (strain Ellin6076) TaxID=234267 RepID=Q01SP5_SOLUE